MGEPALNKHDEDENRYLSARERANSAWGMDEPPELPDENEDAPDNVASLDEARNRKKSLDADELDSAESSAETPEATSPEQSEQIAATKNDGNEIPYRDEGARKTLRSRFSVRQRVTAAVIVFIVGGAFGASTILQGPLQLMHFSQLLQRFHLSRGQETSDNALAKLYRYYRGHDLSRQDRRIGRKMTLVAAKFDARIEQAGLKFKYEDGTGKFLGVEVLDPDGSGVRNLQELGFDPTLDSNGNPVSFDNSDSKFFQNGSRRKLISATFHASGVEGLTGAIGARVEKKRAAASFKWLGNIRRAAADSEAELRQKYRGNYEENVRQGEVVPDTRITPGTDPSDPVNEDGSQTPNEDTSTSSNELNSALDEIANVPAADRFNALREALTRRLESSNKALLLLGLVCAAKSIGNNFERDRWEMVIKPGMRVSQGIVSVGDQMRAPVQKDFEITEPGIHSENYYDEIEGTSWASARGIQAELGEPQTGPDLPDYANPLQKQNSVLAFISGAPLLGPVCGVASNPFVNFGITLLTAGSGAGVVAEVFSDQAADRYIIPKLVSMVANWFTLRGIGSAIAGASFGSIGNTYARILTSDTQIALGGVDMGEISSKSWRNQRLTIDEFELSRLSFAERMFDYKNSQSLAAKIIDNQKPFKAESLQNVAKLPFAAGSSIFSSFSRLFSKTVGAQAEEYDYGFNLYGFTEEELNDTRYEDPYANEDRLDEILNNREAAEQQCAANLPPGVQPWPTCEFGYSSLRELNTGDSDWTTAPEHGDISDADGSDSGDGGKLPAFGHLCFGVDVTEAGVVNHLEAVKFYELPEICADLKSEEWMRYRFLILYLSTEASAACYAGEETACSQLGFGGTSGAAPVSGTADPGQDTSSMQCPAGTEDGDIHQDYGPDGKPTVNIRICGIPGAIPKESGVNASIAEQTLAMISAMRAAGLQPTGNAFRSYERQQALRRSNCPDPINSRASACSPPTAKAGTSMHEVGLAIDFSNMCYDNATCPAGTNDRYDWLMANAATHGFKKLASEAWHWSVTGN